MNPNRFKLDKRTGCMAIWDTEHPNYNPEYPGCHHDLPEIVWYEHGQPQEGGGWEFSELQTERIESIHRILLGEFPNIESLANLFSDIYAERVSDGREMSQLRSGFSQVQREVKRLADEVCAKIPSVAKDGGSGG